jgi:hypothetical protein
MYHDREQPIQLAPDQASPKRTSKMPQFIASQLCKRVSRPPLGKDWVHEIKLDGYRMVADGSAVMRTREASTGPRKKRTYRNLIFVSLAERYARIIADEGISARVPQSEWQAAVDARVAQMLHGRIAYGFITAIDVCGSKLEEHFPRVSRVSRRPETNCRIRALQFLGR